MPTMPSRPLRSFAGALAVVVSAALTLGACGSGGGTSTSPRSTAPAAHVAGAAATTSVTEHADASGIVHLATLAAAGGQSTRLAMSADHSAPRLTGLTWTPTFYPVRDGYRDSFSVAATTNERTWVMLVVRNSKKQLVRRVYAVHDAGRMTISWNGYLGSGRLAPAATYTWSLVWHDSAGNENYSAQRTLTVSHRYLVSRTAHYTLDGNAFWQAGSTDSSCSQADHKGSYYPNGVWLANNCSAAVAAAFYRVRVPAAVSYSTIGVQVWGFTDHPGTRIYRAFGAGGGATSFTGGTFVTIGNTTHGLKSFGTVPASGKISSSRLLVLALSVDNRPSGARDLDVDQVRLAITYRVLN